jgi:hypothetical protein
MHMTKFRGHQKVLLCFFLVFPASGSNSVAISKVIETIAFSLCSSFFRPSKTLFTDRIHCHPRLRKRIAKIGSVTKFLKISFKNTGKAKSSFPLTTRSKIIRVTLNIYFDQ